MNEFKLFSKGLLVLKKGKSVIISFDIDKKIFIILILDVCSRLRKEGRMGFWKKKSPVVEITSQVQFLITSLLSLYQYY